MKSVIHMLRNRRGSALIEFAMLAPVFFMIVMGMAEFVLYEYKVYGLNHMVYEATRNLQTGEVQNAGSTTDQSAAFSSNACAVALPLIDCTAVVFDVRNFETIDAITYPPVVFDQNGNPANFVFQPGGPNRYSVVRAVLEHDFVTPFMGKFFGNGQDVPAIINGYVVVKNEPWG